MRNLGSFSIEAESTGHSLGRMDQVANWHSPAFIRRAMPAVIKDALFELRARILAYYLMRQLPRNKEFVQSLEDAEASSSLSIIVPVHDAPEVTVLCLQSLEKFAPEAEIILIDDASKLAETREILEDYSKRNGWKLIRNSEPFGHSGANRVGARVATRPYLCLLNSDTVITPWCWRLVTQAFENNPTIGVMGPSTSACGTVQALRLAHYARHSLNESQICEYARRLIAEYSDDSLTDIPWASGFALFIRRSLWEQLGGFDLRIPDYGNEVELCGRALEAGFRVVWVRNSYIHHFGNVSYERTHGKSYKERRTLAAREIIAQKKCGSL